MHDNNSSNPANSAWLISIPALRAFDAAASLGSFKTAADVLGLTPSAVSHQIKGLEHWLGVALFHRAGRSVSLTEAGLRFAPFVRQGFTAFGRGIVALREGRRAQQIRVSSLALFSQTVLIPNLAGFAQRWPSYDVRIESTPRYADFDREDVDVAIRVGNGDWPGLTSTELLRIRGLPVASHAYREQHAIRTPQDLSSVRLIHDTAQPAAWRTWLELQGVTARSDEKDLWFDSAPTTLQAAEQGLGVTLAIDPLVRTWPGFGDRLAPLFPQIMGPYTRYWAARRTESDRDPKIRAFISWLREACLRQQHLAAV